ncbi:MAG: hypothetical protein KTR30_01550 [Saprospiraceae bacterium]|nr:hypothetical protein [Saprospiraceae bacterium]
MKTHLLLLLLFGIGWLPIAHTQLLTPIPDTTTHTRPDKSALNHHFAVGLSNRVVSGYRQMRDFYASRGFDNLFLEELVTLGAGFRLSDRYHLELSFDQSIIDDVEDVEWRSRGNFLSLNENEFAIHLLFGYRFWQKRHQSLIFHTGFSWLQNRGEIVERRTQDFDFETANIDVSQGVQSWPVFIHQQGAIHLAIQLKLSYPRPRWWSTDLEMKLGFVSGLKAKSWSVDPGQALNAPMDRGQYFYISSLYHFFLY